MDINKIKPGKNFPNDINVIIEVPAHSDPVKYEFDKEAQMIIVDRFIKTPMYYPCNYGFVPHTLSDDGDPIDVMVICDYRLVSGCVINVKPVGVLIMEDESGMDEKIIAVPTEKLDIKYKDVNDVKDIDLCMLNKIVHFFEHYKDLEKGKWVKVKGFESKELALNIINKALVK